MSGYVHVYTGDGKGKTTAALGLAMRAAGAGWKVFFAQFSKGTQSSELQALERFAEEITVRRYGSGRFIDGEGDVDDCRRAQQGLAECREALVSGAYRLVVLDEANVAAMLRLFDVDDLIDLIDARPDGVELVLTGRWAHAEVLDRADLVTEMREVKHYYSRGVLARAGIEH